MFYAFGAIHIKYVVFFFNNTLLLMLLSFIWKSHLTELLLVSYFGSERVTQDSIIVYILDSGWKYIRSVSFLQHNFEFHPFMLLYIFIPLNWYFFTITLISPTYIFQIKTSQTKRDNSLRYYVFW